MADVDDWNVTDASNTDIFPENQAAGSVNDGGRAVQGAVARWLADTNGSLVSGGSSNAYTLSPNRTISAYSDGLCFTFESNFANTGAATLNVNSVSADPIVWPDGTALVSGDIPSGAKISVCYDNDNSQWMLISATKVPLNVTSDALCRIKTGTYTGDGSTSLGVTGIGFTPKYVRIWKQVTVDTANAPMFETTDSMVDNNASGMAMRLAGGASGYDGRVNTIISLDSDGFTVDDAGANADPNTDGQEYEYLCLG